MVKAGTARIMVVEKPVVLPCVVLPDPNLVARAVRRMCLIPCCAAQTGIFDSELVGWGCGSAVVPFIAGQRPAKHRPAVGVGCEIEIRDRLRRERFAGKYGIGSEG